MRYRRERVGNVDETSWHASLGPSVSTPWADFSSSSLHRRHPWPFPAVLSFARSAVPSFRGRKARDTGEPSSDPGRRIANASLPAIPSCRPLAPPFPLPTPASNMFAIRLAPVRLACILTLFEGDSLSWRPPCRALLCIATYLGACLCATLLQLACYNCQKDRSGILGQRAR